MRVTLITTVLNEERSIVALLESVRQQTRVPDEVVVVDGGSTDRTVELIQSFHDLNLRCIVHPSNIATGRNLAIRAAHHDLIAVTDAGCRLSPDWIKLMTDVPAEIDVVVGNYRPMISSLFDACQCAISGLFSSDKDLSRFGISSRSLAFRHRVWDEIGGYPEYLDYSEDMYFHKQIIARGYKLHFARSAFVTWEQRSTLRAVLKQYFRYMEGDGIAGMHTLRHMARFVSYAVGLGLSALSLVQPLALIPLAAGTLLYLSVPYAAFIHLQRYSLLGPALVLIPALLLSVDGAKMAGYISGRIRSVHERLWR